ncbi:transmembrane protein 141 [Macrosteles quadrilineatus]|uniref:transmembrane protein 141 n=1 Tax=Macrosteles quadrilineatus TaxID=74068 RepID=UPI0023E2388A|nr:transmembrane protein 141 [Macrosteles quadrilineatus]XP_054283929.1 transmembrane protein 141 [Macrosteles quadrilineatus]XP_054283930.1 transmembrane protein 141 [Macrosteles quadrilineatus]XP_054283931.1 transmembrane protein 141 [Macrosteles quadrilineatus]XP_054283932.1 transmembrane protein 141 [Macrosteles quadrilineatus]
MSIGTGKQRLIDLYGDDHPGFGSYLECMTRANFASVAGFTLAFSSTYIGQTLLKNKLPYSPKFSILNSTVIATIIAYKVSKSRSSACQAAWLAAEDKVTYLTELENDKKTS